MARRKRSNPPAHSPPPAPERPVLGEVPTLVRLEREVEAEFRPAMLVALESKVKALGAVQQAPTCDSCQAVMKSHGVRGTWCLTRFGRLPLRARRYRCMPCKRERRPLLETLGVEAGRVSGSLARLLALLGVVVPYELAAKLALELLGVHVSAMCVWRAVQRLGETCVREDEALVRYHADSRSEAAVANEPPRCVVFAPDGCALGMQVRNKRRRRATPDEVLPPLPPVEEGNFREVKTGVLLLPDERVETSPGRRSVVKRYLVTCLGDADEIYARVWARLCELGWHGSQTVVIVVGDGAEWIWNRAQLFPNRCEILDFWHAVEHAWEFARLHFGEGSTAADRWIHRLAGDLRDGKVEQVIRRLKALSLTNEQEREKRDALVRYYVTHTSRMRYAEYLRLGYGIGSGAVESAHKQVVHARLRQAGMRWSEAGARRLLALRLLLLNDDWKRLDGLRMARVG